MAFFFFLCVIFGGSVGVLRGCYERRVFAVGREQGESEPAPLFRFSLLLVWRLWSLIWLVGRCPLFYVFAVSLSCYLHQIFVAKFFDFFIANLRLSIFIYFLFTASAVRIGILTLRKVDQMLLLLLKQLLAEPGLKHLYFLPN